MMLRAFYILLILLLLGNLNAQEIKIYHKYQDGELFLRWLPEDTLVWEKAIANGYNLTINNLSKNESQTLKINNTASQFISLDPDIDERTEIAWMLYPDQIPEDYAQGSSALLAERYIFLNLDISERFEYIEMSGLGHKFKVEEGDNYLISVETPGNRNDVQKESISFNSRDYKNPMLPDLIGGWSNQKVTLSWNTINHKDDFLYYNLYISEDGVNFKIVDSLFANFADVVDSEILHKIQREVELEKNDITYYFRIYGRDYLGGKSNNYSETSGRGKVQIAFSPFIEKLDQLKTNEADIRWKILDKYEPLVKEYRLYVAESYDGPYFPDTVGLSPDTKTVIRPIPFGSSYFRIAAVDEDEIEYSSFPRLINSLDTIPPATPINLKAEIDSSGYVTMSWSSNDEKDFLGYKVFYGFDSLSEMTLAHRDILFEPLLTDTVGLISTNEVVYYKAISIDRRNNRSPFSEILKVKKPDILAPAEPHFYEARSLYESCKLAWHPSVSEDVISQQLFRRQLEVETDWTLLKEWDMASMDTTFIDSDLLPFAKYAYIITVKDDDGNTSRPSEPAIVTVLPDHQNIDLDNWTIEKLDNGNVRFFHQFDSKDIFEIVLYKEQEGQKPFSVAILPKGKVIYDDSEIKLNTQYNYFIQITMNDGFKTKFSPKKSIE